MKKIFKEPQARMLMTGEDILTLSASVNGDGKQGFGNAPGRAGVAAPPAAGGQGPKFE